MPDWFAHLMFGTCLSTCFRMTREKRVIFLIGNVMPDFVRLLSIISTTMHLLPFTTLIAIPLNNGSHSLLGVLAYSVFVSIFFESSLELKQTPVNIIKAGRVHVIMQKWQSATDKPLFLLVIGGIAHLFLDTFMWPFGGGIFWLYPLNSAVFEWSFKLWWPSSLDAIIIITPFFVAALVAELAIAVAKKRMTKTIPC